MNRVTVSAPGKLMLLGEHAVVYNRPCLVTAVNQRMKVTVELIRLQEFYLDAPDVKISGYKKNIAHLGVGEIPKGAQFVEIAIKNFFIHTKVQIEKHGLYIKTASEFSSQFGFGSSSASTVCIVKALAELFKKNLSNKEIFEIAYKTVLDIQGKGSGFDIAAAIYGGTLYFLTGGKKIESISISRLPLIVGYCGVKADTVTLMNQVKAKFTGNENRLEEIYTSIKHLVEKANKAIKNEEWQEMGKAMNGNQELLQELGVSIPKLDEMINAAKNAGAYGAKLSGAGGGDCMIALVPEEKKEAVGLAISKVGGEIIPVLANAEGVRVEL